MAQHPSDTANLPAIDELRLREIETYAEGVALAWDSTYLGDSASRVDMDTEELVVVMVPELIAELRRRLEV